MVKKILLAAISFLAAASAAQADTYTYSFQELLTGSQVANDNAVATLKVYDETLDGKSWTHFALTGSLGALNGSRTGQTAYVDYLNFDGATRTSTAALSGNGLNAIGGISFKSNGNDAGYDYNWKVSFANSNRGDRFVGTDSAEWRIQGMTSDFLAPGSALLLHVNNVYNVDGIGSGQSIKLVGSRVVTNGGVVSAVPEPETYALFGSGLMMMTMVAMRRRKLLQA